MARRPGRPRTGQEPLSRQRIVAAALAIVDRDGIAALTIRRLAADLGVDPMAIYHHLPGKDALLAALVEDAFAGLRLAPAADLPWSDRVRRFAHAYRDAVRSHPNLVRHLVANAPLATAAALASCDELYAALEAAGLPPVAVVRAADLVIDYVHGFALAEPAPIASGGGLAGRADLAERLHGCPTAELPAMRRAFAALGDEDLRAGFGSVAQDLDASFAFGLAVILAGLAPIAGGNEPAWGDAPPDG